MKKKTRGRPRIGKEVMVQISIAVAPELKEALLGEAHRAGKTLSQMGAYAIQRWLNAQEHVRHIEKTRTYINDQNIIL